MKVLLLGKGYIGNYLTGYLNNKCELTHISKADYDYTDFLKFKDFLYKNSKFDWIINSSGYTGRPNVESCETDRENCYHYNVTVPLALTKAANEFNIPIIHIGSGCIYDGYEKVFTEEDATNFGVDNPFSSFYSKTKDAFEKLSSTMERYIFRIRIPFNGVPESKNYLWKLLAYNNLISQKNSITNVNDLVEFTWKFIQRAPAPGIYNVLNSGSIEAGEIIEVLKQNGLENPNWKIVSITEAKFKVGRSNCCLSTQKIKNLGLELPDAHESINKAIQQYRYQIATNLK